MASVFLVPVVCVAFVAEAVRPIPGPVGPDQARDNDAGLEPSELPGPARDGDHSLTTRKIEDDMAERDVVARAGHSRSIPIGRACISGSRPSHRTGSGSPSPGAVIEGPSGSWSSR